MSYEKFKHLSLYVYLVGTNELYAIIGKSNAIIKLYKNLISIMCKLYYRFVIFFSLSLWLSQIIYATCVDAVIGNNNS